MILLIVCAFAGIALVDLRVVAHRKKRRETIVLLSLLVPALAIALLLALGVKIPSTVEALGGLFERIFGKIYPQQ
ncbi:MAG: hypothetical protein GX592_00410 [Clostridiales bacterium]|nr:hypothetical protein [Clostridiales bacterium]